MMLVIYTNNQLVVRKQYISLDCEKKKHRIEIIQHRRAWRGEGATKNLEAKWLGATVSQYSYLFIGKIL